MTRQRKFNPRNLFLTILQLSASTNNEGYSSALCKTWQRLGRAITKMPANSSLSEFREKVSYNFFAEIFDNSRKRNDLNRQTFKGLHVYAIDGDHLDLPASKDVLAKGFRGVRYSRGKETHYPKMYTVQALDLINAQVKVFKFSSQVSEVRMARELLPELEQNSVCIYDRLHSKYHTMLGHIEAGNYFLVRAIVGLKSNLDVQKFAKSHRLSMWINLEPNLPDKRKGLKALRVRLVKIKNKRTGEKLIFITNLPESKFSRRELAKLYQRRWEIEGHFRDLTHTMKLGQWHSKNINGILQEIYALLWLVNAVKSQCSKLLSPKDWLKDDYEKANFKLCTELVLNNLELLISGRTRKLAQLLNHFIDRTKSKRRHLSRSYPRQVKRHGKKYLNASTVKTRP